jgi:hypothetical protein
MPSAPSVPYHRFSLPPSLSWRRCAAGEQAHEGIEITIERAVGRPTCCRRAADSILGVSLFADHSPTNFMTFDRSFMTFFRIAGIPSSHSLQSLPISCISLHISLQDKISSGMCWTEGL